MAHKNVTKLANLAYWNLEIKIKLAKKKFIYKKLKVTITEIFSVLLA